MKSQAVKNHRSVSRLDLDKQSECDEKPKITPVQVRESGERDAIWPEAREENEE